MEISFSVVCLKLFPLDNHFSGESGKGFYHRVTETANYSSKVICDFSPKVRKNEKEGKQSEEEKE